VSTLQKIAKQQRTLMAQKAPLFFFEVLDLLGEVGPIEVLDAALA
jgi:hypothetical protein